MPCIIPNILQLIILTTINILSAINIPSSHTCKKREIAEIYIRNFFWIFRKILG